MNAKDMKSSSTPQSVSVDKAPTTPRPFSNIPNYYDHSCSVLCNHPLGPRLSWFARRFVWTTNMFRNQALNRAGILPPNLSRSDLSQSLIEMTDASIPEEHSDYWLYSSFTPELGNIVSPSLNQRKRFAQLPPLSRTAASQVPVVEPIINKVSSSLYDARPDSKANYTNVKEMRHAHFPLSKKQSKDKKGSSPRKKSGKKSKKHSKGGKRGDADKKESGEDELDADGSPQPGKKERRRKTTANKEFPVTREEVENPFTLVEGESCSSGPARRRSHRNRDGLVGSDGKSASIDGSEWNEDDQSSLQKQLDEELEGSEFDPKLQELQNVLQTGESSTKRTTSAAKEMQAISEEISRKSIRSDAWMHYPRIPCRHSCRFELPMDAKILISLSPIDYLSAYCKVPRKRRQLFFKVFTKYRGVESNIATENIPKAMGDIFGHPIPDSVLQPIFTVAGINTGINKLEFNTFAGLAALTERFLSKEVMMDNDQYKDTVEELDFKDLTVHVEGIHINENVNELLHCIQQT